VRGRVEQSGEYLFIGDASCRSQTLLWDGDASGADQNSLKQLCNAIVKMELHNAKIERSRSLDDSWTVGASVTGVFVASPGYGPPEIRFLSAKDITVYPAKPLTRSPPPMPIRKR